MKNTGPASPMIFIIFPIPLLELIQFILRISFASCGLNNNFYGDIFSLQYHNAKTEFTVGGAYTRYEGDHYGKLIWAEHGLTGPDIYYDHDAFKNDLNSYAKLLQKFSKNWNAYIDLQYRHVKYDINGFEDNL